MKTACLSLLILCMSLSSLKSQKDPISIQNMTLESLENTIDSLMILDQYREALPFSKQRIELSKRKTGENSETFLRAIWQNSYMNYRLGNYEQAIGTYRITINLIESLWGKNNLEYIQSVIDLSLCLNQTEQIKGVEAMLEEAVVWVRENLEPSDIYFFKAVRTLADIYYKNGKYEPALEFHEEWVDLAEKLYGKKHTKYVQAYSSMGFLYRETGKYTQAIEILEETVQLDKELHGENSAEYATALNNLGLTYKDIGRYDKTVPFYKKATEIREGLYGKMHPMYAQSLNNTASVYQELGQYELALPLYQTVAEVLEKVVGKEHQYYFYTINNIGTIYEQMGNMDTALVSFHYALDIFEKVFGLEHPLYSRLLNNISKVYLQLGQAEKSMEIGRKAKLACEKNLGKEHPDYINTLNVLADCHLFMKEEEKALPILKEAIKIAKTTITENSYLYSYLLNNLGGTYFNLGQIDSAGYYYTECVKTYEALQGKNHPELPHFQTNLAKYFTSIGEHEKALSLLKTAFEIRKKTVHPNHPNYNLTLYRLILACEQLDKSDSAERHLRELFRNYANQLHQYYPYMNEKSRLKFLTSIETEMNRVSGLIVKYPNLSENLQNLQLSLKGLALENSIEIRSTISSDVNLDEAFKTKYAEWKSLRRKIEKANTMSLSKRKEENINLETLITECESLEAELNRDAQTGQITSNHSWRNRTNTATIRENLDEEEVAVDILSFQYHNGQNFTDTVFYYALINRKDSAIPDFVKLCSKKDLFEILSSSVTSENNMNYITNPEKNHQLYQLVWQPLEPYLREIEKVNISPAGLLNQVAFDALQTKKTGGKLLLNKYKISRYGNLRDFIFEEKNAPFSQSITAVGGAYYDLDSTQLSAIAQRKFNAEETLTFTAAETGLNLRSAVSDSTRSSIRFNYLSGTKKEVENIHRQFSEKGWKSNLITGPEALESQIKTLSGNRASDILHIATHGYFFNKNDQNKTEGSTLRERIMNAENPLLRSGLVFSGVNHSWLGGQPIEGLEDGVLTAYEISNLDLFNTKLAVLSACETGRGDIHDAEGVFGLQRAFKTAGVDQLIISLWKVPDMATSEMMSLFYQYYLKGNSVKAAFRKAQSKMAKKYEAYYWGAFVLVE